MSSPIRSYPSTEQYREAWERVFGKPVAVPARDIYSRKPGIDPREPVLPSGGGTVIYGHSLNIQASSPYVTQYDR